jgi:hypothetical protein
MIADAEVAAVHLPQIGDLWRSTEGEGCVACGRTAP